MKLQSIYLLLVPALLSVSCSSDPEQSGSERVPIELHASGDGVVTTKADQTITESFPTTVFASMRDGGYTGLSTSSTGYEWMKDTEVETNGAVSLPDDPAYPEDGSWIYLTAVSPKASTSYLNAAGTVSYTLTGQDDLMYAQQIKGNRWDGYRFSNNTNATVIPLNYIHLLTQLKFKAKKVENDGMAVKVKSITVKAVANNVTLTLSDGTTAFAGNDDLTLTVEVGKQEIATTTASDLGVLLLPPLASGGEAYKVTVDTSIGNYKDLPIRFSDSGNPSGDLFAKGHSYEITLNIGNTELEIISVAVASWEPVTVPNGDLDLIE